MSAPDPDAVRNAIERVEALHTELSAASAALAELLNASLGRLIKVGDVIDLDDRKAPEWLWGVDVVRGNPRGARRFEVAEAPRAQVDTAHASLTKWSCEAYRLNADGKRGSGRSHGANGSRETVRLRGQIAHDHGPDDERTEVEMVMSTAWAAVGA